MVHGVQGLLGYTPSDLVSGTGRQYEETQGLYNPNTIAHPTQIDPAMVQQWALNDIFDDMCYNAAKDIMGQIQAALNSGNMQQARALRNYLLGMANNPYASLGNLFSIDDSQPQDLYVQHNTALDNTQETWDSYDRSYAPPAPPRRDSISYA